MLYGFEQFLFRTFIAIIFAASVPGLSYAISADEVVEKRIHIAMRAIGHELLVSAGDCESRVLPIESQKNQFQISFENEFSVDPADIASVTNDIMVSSGISSSYIVELVQCESRIVVHSYEISPRTPTGGIACVGRKMPKDCYDLVITLLDTADESSAIVHNGVKLDSDPPKSEYEDQEVDQASKFNPEVFFVPLLFFIGFIGIYWKRRISRDTDPNLVLIGHFTFDKLNNLLTYNDTNVELSNKEASLLSLLHDHYNQPMTRENLLRQVWGDDGDYIGRTLDVFISKLRKKLETDQRIKIINVRGVGYKMVLNT